MGRVRSFSVLILTTAALLGAGITARAVAGEGPAPGAPAADGAPACAPPKQEAASVKGTVKLRSGDVVEGRVVDEGDRLRVTTATGEVALAWRDVESVLRDRTAKDVFAERRAAVKDGDAAGLAALGLWARRAGLTEEARACFDASLAADPENAASRDALAQQKKDGAWLTGTKLLEAKGFVARDGAWVLKEEAEQLDRRAAEKDLTPDERKAEDLLAKGAAGSAAARKFTLEALGQFDPSLVVRPGLRALRRGRTAEERELGARALGLVRDDRTVLRPLIYSAIMDRDSAVRGAAVASLVSLAPQDLAKPFAKAMWSESPEVRMNAVEALGAIGGASAVEWVITRWQTSGGPGGRNHIFVGSEITYVSDFDVEIAQAAQIGDPIVGKIREGVMLDYRVTNVREEFTTVERRVFSMALQRATGRSFGEDPVAWRKWWDESGKKEMTAAK